MNQKNIVLDIIANNISISQAAKSCNVQTRSVRTWLSNYQSLGDEGLITSSKNTIYSKELKNMAVLDYLSGKDGRCFNIVKTLFIGINLKKILRFIIGKILKF